MKKALKAGWEQFTQLPARERVALLAGLFLLELLLLATAWLWVPASLLGALAALGFQLYKQYQKRIPPARCPMT